MRARHAAAGWRRRAPAGRLPVVPQRFAPLFAPLTQYGAPPIYDQGNLLSLALAHLGTVCLAAAASTLVAVALGILVTRAERCASFCRCRARW